MKPKNVVPDLDTLLKRSKAGITECIRCCTCCSNGGPALHREDKKFLDSGQLHGRFLFTIRQGEPAEDNVKGGLIFADTDIIKIKSKDNSDTCLYADLNKNSCSIYESRPLECRILRCWDTQEIEAKYDKDRLTRRDILGQVEGLWDLIEEHQEHCSYTKIKEILDKNPGNLIETAKKTLLEMVHYDLSLRNMVVEKTGTDPNLLLFLFGHPLQKTLGKFGLELGQNKQ